MLDARAAVCRRDGLDPGVAAEHDLRGEPIRQERLERDEPLLVGRVLEVREVVLLAERVVLDDRTGGGDLAVVAEIEPLVEVAEDDAIGRLAAVDQHLQDGEGVGAARVEVDVHHRTGSGPGPPGGADDALLAGGDGARRSDLADQGRPHLSPVDPLDEVAHHDRLELVVGRPLDPVGVRVVHVEAAPDHDVDARAAGDVGQVGRAPAEPDVGHVDDPRPAGGGDAPQLAHAHLRVIHDQVVREAVRVPAQEAERLERDGRRRGRRVGLGGRLEPDARVDEDVLVHAGRAEVGRLDRAERGMDGHGSPWVARILTAGERLRYEYTRCPDIRSS